MILPWLLGAAWAAAPGHVRVASRPPASWRDLSADAVAVRVWWDGTAADGTVEAALGGRWKTLASAVGPGWESKPLPRGTSVRVRTGEGAWSEPVFVPQWIAPAELARAAGPSDAMLGATVGQLVRDGPDLWGSTLGGGLMRLRDGVVRPFTRWDGLIDDTVVAVDARDGTVLAATSKGATRLTGGVVDRVWDAELPYHYAQAVLLTEEQAWVGTASGLAQVMPEVRVSDVAGGVYSLAAAADGGLWAGIQGLRRVSADGVVGEPVALDGDRIYAIIDGEDGLWVASEKGGVQHGAAAAVAPFEGLPDHWAISLAHGPGGMWAAMGEAGLHGPDGQSYGYADGLPGRSVWSLAVREGGGLWVGTDRGIAGIVPGPPGVRPEVATLPLSQWPARADRTMATVTRRGAWFGGTDGVRAVGRPHRFANNLVVAGPHSMRNLLLDGSDVWAVGRWAVVRMDRRGQLRMTRIRSPATDAAMSRDALWIGGPSGIDRMDPETLELERWIDLPGVTRLVASSTGMWAVADQVPIQIVGRMVRPFMLAHSVEDLAPSEDTVCLGTTNGLEVLFLDGEVVDALGDEDSGVVISAVAADGRGGCWYAGDDGRVGRTTASDDRREVHLPLPEPVGPRRIVADGDWAWVITEFGTWRVRLPAG